jgi:hypothetical protein
MQAIKALDAHAHAHAHTDMVTYKTQSCAQILYAEAIKALDAQAQGEALLRKALAELKMWGLQREFAFSADTTAAATTTTTITTTASTVNTTSVSVVGHT